MPLSRRALLTAAAVVPPSAVRSSAANAAITVGLIGAGGRGTLDAQLLVKHTSARVVAVCDIVPERIERARKALEIGDARRSRDYRELLDSDVDAVIIATPVFLHPEHLEAAIQAGKHIYIEKPAATDVEGCRRIMRAADAADRKFNITFGFQQRYGPATRKAHALLSSGAIGKLRVAHSHFLKGAVDEGEKEQARPLPQSEFERMRHWGRWRETHGGFIVETYCHGIDILNWFCGGHPVKATGAGARLFAAQPGMHDHVTVTYTYPNQVQATMTGTQVTPRFFRDAHETFFGSTGVLETSRDWFRHHRSAQNIAEEREGRDITIDALQEFVRRIQEGTPENTIVRGAESTLTAILGRTSIDLGREVTWDEMMKA